MEQLNEISVQYRPTKIKAGSIVSSQEAYQFFRQLFSDDTIQLRESFYALYVNNAKKPLGYFLLGLGSTSAVVVDIKLLLSIAIKCNATGIVIAHNHPSGCLKPSKMDVSITTKAKEACKLFDITLLDHLILTDYSYFSFADNGMIGLAILFSRAIQKKKVMEKKTDQTPRRRNKLFSLRQQVPINSQTNAKIRKVTLKPSRAPDKIALEIRYMFKQLGSA